MRRALAVSLVSLGLLVGGCGLFRRVLTGAFEPPTLTFQSASLEGVSLSGVTLDLVYRVDNPNGVALHLEEVDYQLSVEGRPVLSGRPPAGLSLPASGSAVLSFPAQVRFADLAALAELLRAKDRAHYRATGHVGVGSPVGVISLPLAHEGDFEVPKVPAVTFGSPRVTGMSLAGTMLELPVTLTNQNSYALPLGEITGAVDIAGVNVATVTTGDLGGLPARGTRGLRLPLTVRYQGAAQALAALARGPVAITLSGQVQSGSGAIPFRLSQTVSLER